MTAQGLNAQVDEDLGLGGDRDMVHEVTENTNIPEGNKSEEAIQ